jgi:hypothetical protein
MPSINSRRAATLRIKRGGGKSPADKRKTIFWEAHP